MKIRILTIGAVIMAICAFFLWGNHALLAFSSGVTGYSGNPNTTGGQTCNGCHLNGIEPTVTIVGPTAVFPGVPISYTLIISGGQEVAGGFNVSALTGTLATLPGAMDVQAFDDELTHTEPKLVDSDGDVHFSFQWTAPPITSSTTLYGAGNSVDLMDGNNGDQAGTAVLDVQILTPVEALYLPIVIK